LQQKLPEEGKEDEEKEKEEGEKEKKFCLF
jgi:hypothetical protein